MKFEVVAVGELKPDFLSKWIQRFQSWITGKPVDFSHLAVLIDGCRVVDATGRGVAECKLDELLDSGGAVIRKRFEVPVKSACCAVVWLEAKKGLGYSNLQYLGFLFPFLRGWRLVKNGGRRTICSELVADFIRECTTLPRHHFENADFMAPIHVVEMLEFLNRK